MSRFSVGCCRDGTTAANAEPDRQDHVQRPGRVPHRHQRADRVARGDRPGLPGHARTPTSTPPAAAGGDRLRLRRRQEHRVPQSTARPTGPVHDRAHVQQGRTYNVEYRATDRKDNVAAVKTATFTILKINDTTAPTTNATASGNKDQRDYFVGSATLTVTATDDERLRRADDRVPRQRRRLEHVHRSGRVQRAGQLQRRLPRDRQGQQHVGGQDDHVPHPLGRGLHAVPLGRVQRRRRSARVERHTRNGGRRRARVDARRRRAAHADGRLRARRRQLHDVASAR